MSSTSKFNLFAASLLFCTAATQAQAQSQLRELTTDRPDQTESPITVDRGRFQIEVDAISFTRDRDKSGGGNVRTDSTGVAPINLK